MKVLYIAHSSGLQGSGVALLNIIKGIRDFGVTPILVLPQNGMMSEEAEKLNIKCYYCPCSNTIYPCKKGLINLLKYPIRIIRMIVLNYYDIIKLNKIIRIEKPDIIHSNTGTIRFGAIAAKKNNIPHVWHIREYQTLDFGWEPFGGIELQRKLYGDKNNNCIAITKDVFDYFKLNLSKDKVIYDGVFSEKIRNFQSSPSNYFLFVGCLKEGKGIFDAVNAFNQLMNQVPENIEFWLAGKDEVGINKIINECSNPKRIKYLGFRNDIYQLMSRAIALIVPSKFEGFGFITTEAMLNSCLVIGRNTGGTKEQFDNGFEMLGKEIGLRFESIEQLTQLMIEVASNPIAFSEMKERAYSVVRSLYTLEINTKKIYDYYIGLTM